MHAAERQHVLQGRDPFYKICERLELFALPLRQNREWLDDPVAKRLAKLRLPRAQRPEHIRRELPVVRTLLDDCKLAGPPKPKTDPTLTLVK